MALQITNNSGILEINGELNAQNVSSFNAHFSMLLENCKSITVSLNGLEDIDKIAINTISNLYKKALLNNKFFYIIGQENKKINQRFEEAKLYYLLKRDIV